MSKYWEVYYEGSGLEEFCVVTTSYLVMFIILVNCKYHVSVSAFYKLVSVSTSFGWCSDSVMVMLLSVKDPLLIYLVCDGACLICVVASVLCAEVFGHEIFICFNE
jgi:hypothetical protein